MDTTSSTQVRARLVLCRKLGLFWRPARNEQGCMFHDRMILTDCYSIWCNFGVLALLGVVLERCRLCDYHFIYPIIWKLLKHGSNSLDWLNKEIYLLAINTKQEFKNLKKKEKKSKYTYGHVSDDNEARSTTSSLLISTSKLHKTTQKNYRHSWNYVITCSLLIRFWVGECIQYITFPPTNTKITLALSRKDGGESIRRMTGLELVDRPL
jgi:hypothetical protein